MVAGSVALQVWHAQTDPTYAYYATETRVYQLAAGVLLALVTRLVTIKAVSSASRSPFSGSPGSSSWAPAPST